MEFKKRTFTYKHTVFNILKNFSALEFVVFIQPKTLALPGFGIVFRDISELVDYARKIGGEKCNFDSYSLAELNNKFTAEGVPEEANTIAWRDKIVFNVDGVWMSNAQAMAIQGNTLSLLSSAPRLSNQQVIGLWWALQVINNSVSSFKVFDDIDAVAEWMDTQPEEGSKFIRALFHAGFVEAVDDVRPAVLGQLMKFLKSTGIQTHKMDREDLVDSESGVDIYGGGLVIGRFASFGAILYAAGLIATTPENLRHLVTSDFDDWVLKSFVLGYGRVPTELEVEKVISKAIAWAWAAGKKIGFHDHEIIDDRDFEDNGEFIKKQIQVKTFLGVNELESLGLTDREIFPSLHKWLVGTLETSVERAA